MSCLINPTNVVLGVDLNVVPGIRLCVFLETEETTGFYWIVKETIPSYDFRHSQSVRRSWIRDFTQKMQPLRSIWKFHSSFESVVKKKTEIGSAREPGTCFESNVLYSPARISFFGTVLILLHLNGLLNVDLDKLTKLLADDTELYNLSSAKDITKTQQSF